MEMSIEVSRDDSGDTVLSVVGAVDLVSKDELIEVGLRELDRAGCRRLVLDMAGVSFMDSSGLSVLVALDNEAQPRDAEIVVREPSHRVERLLALTGMRQRFLR